MEKGLTQIKHDMIIISKNVVSSLFISSGQRATEKMLLYFGFIYFLKNRFWNKHQTLILVFQHHPPPHTPPSSSSSFSFKSFLSTFLFDDDGNENTASNPPPPHDSIIIVDSQQLKEKSFMHMKFIRIKHFLSGTRKIEFSRPPPHSQ